jgi:hypothetical protein
MFDTAHRQDEGNAFWLVDDNAPNPSPASPTRESDWNGGISSWGYRLWASGRYAITQLPEGTALNHGGGGSGDLSNVNVFVSVEPERRFSAAEQRALMSFLDGGGGVYLIADHAGAVRCGSCVAGCDVLNDFLVTGQGTAVGLKCDGNTVGDSGLFGSLVAPHDTGPLGAGPFGAARRLAFFSGSSVSVTGTNVDAAVVVSAGGAGMMATATLGQGRVVLVGDSSTTDDGTCVCSAALYDGWRNADNATMTLNATAWLARDGS